LKSQIDLNTKKRKEKELQNELKKSQEEEKKLNESLSV
jgi:hypothetical protein